MILNQWLQCLVFLGVLLGLAWPLGLYMARVYEDRPSGPLDRVLGPVERLLYRLCGVRPENEMNWKQYLGAVLWLNVFGFLVVYALQRLQGRLPLNPMEMPAVSPDSSFNTAISFATNTNWQGYGGEATMSYLTQMLALTVQNFISAATGMAVLVALIRGLTRNQSNLIGNFWKDLVRSTLYILLPLSIVLALLLMSQGVVQTLAPYATADLMSPTVDGEGAAVAHQTIALGPAASQLAIKQLGTNGGGFFNANSAHPFENPTAISNFLQVIAILLVAAGLCITFGKMTRDMRQGWALLAAMTIIFAGFLVICVWAEQRGNPTLASAGLVDAQVSALQSGGNMEGKEVRFGITNSALWATATTAASNGSVNAMHDSFTPLGGLVPMVMIKLGEVVFGGVGSGLYGMLVFVFVAVFIAGLMVGRTPEYLGKKIESFEIKMASIVLLAPPLAVLIGNSLACLTEAGKAGVLNPGPHGFSEMLYAFGSAANNNGSAFAGLSANTPFYNGLLGLAMLIGRYWPIVAVLAIAGALARKKIVPSGAGTLPTHTPLFVALLVCTVLIMGALTFIPALALGPIVEHLLLY